VIRFAWTVGEGAEMEFRRRGGKFIVPVPEAEVV
jgi:hypothetical protein